MHKNPKLGEIIMEAQQRDAIHVAVAPIVAGALLKPGAHIKIDGLVALPVKKDAPSDGVVDPFLREPAEEGETFWMMLHPGSITSLRHEWTHPAFADIGTPKETPSLTQIVSEIWMRDYALSLGVDYEDLIEGGKDWLATGDYLCKGAQLEGECTTDEFWTHFHAITGQQVTEEKRGNFFTCSC